MRRGPIGVREAKGDGGEGRVGKVNKGELWGRDEFVRQGLWGVGWGGGQGINSFNRFYEQTMMMVERDYV